MNKILSNKIFIGTLFADIVSNLGDTLYYLALMNYAISISESKIALAMISFSETLPVFSSFFVGVLSDRTKHKIQIIQLTLLFRMILYILLGFFMQFPPALWIVILASTFNFFGDLAGQYENGLYLPISLRVVSNEERQEFLAFRHSVTLTTSIAFKFLSAFLIGFLSMTQLAWVNAGTFLYPILVLQVLTPKIQELFSAHPVETSPSSNKKNFWKESWDSLKELFHQLQLIPTVQSAMLVILVIEGLFSILPVLFTLTISQSSHFVILNLPTSLAYSLDSNPSWKHTRKYAREKRLTFFPSYCYSPFYLAVYF